MNAPDLHRVRHSLSYFADLGWEPIILAVDPVYVEEDQDASLLATLPDDLSVCHVPALDYRWTRVFGLGNLALRSLASYRRAGNRLLSQGGIDLVFFSTTAFPLPILGTYWKRKFGVPYVIDMQDPWHSDYYRTRPRRERPPKYWFAYQMHKYLEPIAMREVDAIISVSQQYCDTLVERYPNIRPEKCAVIPFGGAPADFDVLEQIASENTVFDRDDGRFSVVYVGRGGYDLNQAAHGIFGALALGLEEHPGLFSRVRMYFIGTDYAPKGKGIKTLEPIAHHYGLSGVVHEDPDRKPYFDALQLLRDADMLMIPGSHDPAYTASKLYPYILARKPLLAVFHERSSVVDILRATKAGDVVCFDSDSTALMGPNPVLSKRILTTWTALLKRLPFTPPTDWNAFEPYTAWEMTRRQVEVFERVLDHT